MPSLHGQKVFAVGEGEFRWEDVVAAARRWGEWDVLVETTRQGLTCQKARSGQAVASAEVEAAANEFRYARDLIATEEMEAWLAARGLSAEDWMAWVERSVLRGRRTGGPIASSRPVSLTELETLLPVEAVCSGSMGRWSRRLAGQAAVAEAQAQSPHEAGAARLARLEDSFQRFRGQVLTEDAVRRAVADHRLDWLRVRGLCARFEHASAAREAALCVRDDGMSLQEVAASAHGATEPFDWLLEDCAPALASALLKAQPGETVGPVAVEAAAADATGAVLLAFVESRLPPDAADPLVRERAERRLLERAVDGEVQRRVHWYLQP